MMADRDQVGVEAGLIKLHGFGDGVTLYGIMMAGNQIVERPPVDLAFDGVRINTVQRQDHV